MKTATALAAVLAAALFAPDSAALAKTHKADGHKAGAHHAASGHAKAHPASGHAARGHGHGASGGAHLRGVSDKKGKHGKAEKSSGHGKHGKAARHERVAPPPPPPKPQILTPPSRADRVILPANVQPSHYDLSITPDAAHDAFTAIARIDVEVKSATRTIQLNAVDLTFASVNLTGASGAPLTPKWAFDAQKETATLTFASNVKPGRYTLSIAYGGKINGSAAGIFHLDYDTAGGKARALFTQFENSDARRFMPSWDEPDRKATFSLTADVPADQMAVSNMPVASSDTLANGLKRVRFAQTPKMSSYLLFFGLGDFERVTRKVGNTEIGVVVKRGDTARADYALNAASQIIGYYNDYFGTPYPLPKLDMIAGPGSSQFFGAMENWGAIFYFERDMLVDPQLATVSQQQRVYTNVAHEMAHQWFGDLVTMDWWDDLWLNEGFAVWMEDKASNHFHPEWNLQLKALGARDTAMALDAREGAHQVVQHVRDVQQASQAFDAITYQKGAAVIGMLESYVGEDVFRQGVRNYMRDHAYGNTVTDDLWKEIDGIGPIHLTEVAHDFTLQPGVPLIRVTQQGGGATLEQSRFGADAPSKASLRWDVPVTTARAYGAGSWSGIVSRVAPASLKPPVDGLVVNAGQTGYFRTLYVGPMFLRLTDAWPRLTPADQYGALTDASALAFAGYQPMGDLLTLIDRTGSDLDPVVAGAVISRLQQIGRLERGLAGETAFKTFARARLQPLYAAYGFEPRPDEAPPVTETRGLLLRALADFDDPTVIADARARYTAWKADHSALKPDVRSAVLNIVASNADAATWDELKSVALTAPTALERSEFYRLLGAARAPDLAKKALDLAFAPETPLTEGPSILRVVADRFPDEAVDFAIAHPQAVKARLEESSASRFLPSLASGSSSSETPAKLDAYAEANIAATSRRPVVAAKSAMSLTRERRSINIPEVDRWLASHEN